jgi:hypothetical protein
MEIESFSYEESLAVVRLIWILIFSNNEITRNESDYFQKSLSDFGLTMKEIETYLQLPEEETYEVIRNMSSKKRSECGRLLRLAYNTDKSIDRKELSTLNEIINKAELFRPDKNSRKNDDSELL